MAKYSAVANRDITATPELAVTVTLGSAIRNRRVKAGLRLNELAKRTDLSSSYLSQVERDRICPSIVALGRIAQGLETGVGAIFSEIDESARAACSVVRRDDRKTILFPNSAIRNELLVRNLQGALEVIWSKIPPGSRSPEFKHDGEECGVILSGSLHYWVEGESYILNEGDAISYKSNVPHRYENRTNRIVETIWIITPPGF
jgi:quercetin dioxygenase-like cupin family protein